MNLLLIKQENPNEIIVGLNTNIDEHVARAIGLLEVSTELQHI